MSLKPMAEVITIDSTYTRSINIERDKNAVEVTKGYVPTSRSISLLERMEEVSGQADAPRAWSLIGPYGSGKSSFSLFYSALVSDPNSNIAKVANSSLADTDASLAQAYGKLTKGTSGFIKILITGAPESLTERVYNSIKQVGLEVLGEKFAKQIGEEPQELTISSVTQLLRNLQKMLEKQTSYKGILLVIDELGKFLEYEARHYGANEIYLLQELAEFAYSGNKVNVYVCVLLHQSFEQYARGLSDAFKSEWSKVQGRYEEVPFLEGVEQTLRVVSKAINTNLTPQAEKKIKAVVHPAVEKLEKLKALPSTLAGNAALELFESCYPLHPVTALLLPTLCQKFAQNERTLFSYLSSKEQSGFQSEIERLEVGDFITPDGVFDYFVLNQSSAIHDQLTSRRWAEVIEAIDRLGEADELQARLLKTVGIFNILGAKGGFKSSKDVLTTLADKDAVEKALQSLVDSSVVTFRKFSGEYRVWQGSDFNLQEALEEQRSQLGKVSTAEYLNEVQILGPIIARKYTVESGALRYFEPMFCDERDIKGIATEHSTPRIHFILNAKGDLKPPKKSDDVWVHVRNSEKLTACVEELVALQRIESANQQLTNDPIALRELREHLRTSENTLRQVVGNLLTTPSFSTWYFQAKQHPVLVKRDLQRFLSDVLTSVYSKAPVVANELINRDKLSSQAAAGRNKLLFAMLNDADKEDFGISKFPPEKAMYRAVFKAHDIHVDTGKRWKVQRPGNGSSVLLVWKAIEEYFDNSVESPRPIQGLYDIITAPPFGVKLGLAPVLVLTVFFSKQNELAMYEEGVFLPSLTEDAVERFLRLPHLFSFQSFKLEGLNASVFESYQSELFNDGKKRSVIDIAKPLAKFIGDLEPYTRKTRDGEVSLKAQKVVRVFDSAKSPHKLLFEDLPKALGFKEGIHEQKIADQFVSELVDVFKELKYVFPNMLDRQVELLCNTLNVSKSSNLSDVRGALRARFQALLDYAADTEGTKAFLKRLVNKSDSDEKWLQSCLTFLSDRLPKDWTDADRAKAEYQLLSHAKKIHELDRLRIEYDSHHTSDDEDIDVMLVRILKKGQTPIQQPIVLDRRKSEYAEKLKQRILEQLDDKQLDSDLKLVALTSILEDIAKE